MSVWSDVFLGVIAVATLAIAIAQLGVMVAAGRLARRVERLTDQFEQEIRPLLGHLTAITRDASRATALATAQVERVDHLFGDLAGRVEKGLAGLQSAIGGPAREGRALLVAFRAAFEAIHEVRGSRRYPSGPRRRRRRALHLVKSRVAGGSAGGRLGGAVQTSAPLI